MKVPLYLGFSEQISNPQFDPLNPDITFNDATRTLTREERKERLETIAHLYPKAKHQLDQRAQGTRTGQARSNSMMWRT